MYIGFIAIDTYCFNSIAAPLFNLIAATSSAVGWATVFPIADAGKLDLGRGE